MDAAESWRAAARCRSRRRPWRPGLHPWVEDRSPTPRRRARPPPLRTVHVVPPDETETTMVEKVLVVAAGVAFAAFVISRQIRRRKVTARGLVILPVWFLALALLADHTVLGRLHTVAAAG